MAPTGNGNSTPRLANFEDDLLAAHNLAERIKQASTDIDLSDKAEALSEAVNEIIVSLPGPWDSSRCRASGRTSHQ